VVPVVSSSSRLPAFSALWGTSRPLLIWRALAHACAGILKLPVRSLCSVGATILQCLWDLSPPLVKEIKCFQGALGASQKGYIRLYLLKLLLERLPPRNRGTRKGRKPQIRCTRCLSVHLPAGRLSFSCPPLTMPVGGADLLKQLMELLVTWDAAAASDEQGSEVVDGDRASSRDELAALIGPALFGLRPAGGAGGNARVSRAAAAAQAAAVSVAPESVTILHQQRRNGAAPIAWLAV
jgi:hypothetical protein